MIGVLLVGVAALVGSQVWVFTGSAVMAYGAVALSLVLLFIAVPSLSRRLMIGRNIRFLGELKAFSTRAISSMPSGSTRKPAVRSSKARRNKRPNRWQDRSGRCWRRARSETSSNRTRSSRRIRFWRRRRYPRSRRFWGTSRPAAKPPLLERKRRSSRPSPFPKLSPRRRTRYRPPGGGRAMPHPNIRPVQPRRRCERSQMRSWRERLVEHREWITSKSKEGKRAELGKCTLH